MGKLKKNLNSTANNVGDQESGLDWEQLLVGYQNQTIDEVLMNLMNKVRRTCKHSHHSIYLSLIHI